MNVEFGMPIKVDEPAAGRFNLREYLNFAWRHWKFIGAVACLALLIAVIYLVRAHPLYTATTQVLLEPQREKAPGLDANSFDLRYDDISFVGNQLAILKSDSLLRRVAIKERLAVAPPKDAQSGQAVANADAKAAEEKLIQDGIDRIRGALTVRRNPQSQVLDIAVTWNDPARAAELANAVADAYVVDQLDARLESAKRASGWLSDRLIELRQQLRDSEEAAAKFRKERGLTRSGPTVALNEQQLADLNCKLICARH